MINTDPIVRIKRSAVPGKRPTTEQLLLGELGLNTYDGELTAKRERPGIGTDIIRIGAGTTVTNILYVTKDGNDTNTGKKLGDAKATIAGAVAAAEPGTVIKVSAGTYVENNPIALPNQVSVIGDSLREVSVTPQNSGDLFYVGNGNYIAEMSFSGAANPGAIFAFNPNIPVYNNQSPYVQNCTNFIPNSIGMKIDGSKSIGPTKSMVLDSYTQYNQGGIGISITNEGYAQLVSLFTICPDTAVYCGSGSACDLTNSNASFGNYGLIADGIGPRKYTGIITSAAEENVDTFVLNLNAPTLNIISASYDNVSGILTATTNNPHKFSVGMGISISKLKFTCPSVNTVTNYNISTANYTNTTGILTVTTSTNHNFTVGISVTMSNLVFSCNSGGGISTAYFPPAPGDNNGDSNYIFNVISIPASNQFVVNVGTSTITHNYVNNGIVSISTIATFPSGNYGYIFETLAVAPSRYVDSYNLIQANRQEIVNSSYNAIGVAYPGFINPNPDKCKRDIGYIIDAVSTDVRDFTSENSIKATKSYFTPNGTLLPNGLEGEIPQTIVGFSSARDLMKLAITNNLTIKDLSISADPLTGSNISPNSCSNVQSFIDNLVGIITTNIGSGNLNSLPSVSMASTTFSVYVGPTTFSHTYNSGGTVKINVVRPFDGQVVYFDDLYYTVNKINVSAGGTGYTNTPTITIDEPLTDWGVQATAAAEIKNGSVVAIQIISSGRGYTSIPTVSISSPDVGINTAVVSLENLPTYYSIVSSTPVSSGICTITVNENVPYAVGVGSAVPFFKQSRILASGHSFEYIGSGTNINSALPAQGGVAIPNNEIDMRSGGLVVYTSTDQSGNFRIGEGIAVNQLTGTISGSSYSKSLFSTMTPFILALGGE